MRTFYLHRDIEETGISGTGKVAKGVVICWLTEVSSMAFYKSLSDVEAIHGHGGKTGIVFAESTRIGLKGLRGSLR